MASQTISIPLSKKGLYGSLFGFSAFVSIGIWILNSAASDSTGLNSIIGILLGLVIILVFGMPLLCVILKLIDRKPGLIISDKGIHDNASLFSVGFVPWKDIVGIQDSIVINIFVKNPLFYLDKQKNPLKKFILKISYQVSGTTVGIPSNMLKYDPDKLLDLLISSAKKYVVAD